jgi:hypothetical protein
MPLSSWFNQHWYPESLAMLGTAGSSEVLSIKNDVRMAVASTSTATQSLSPLLGRTMSLLNTSVSYEALSMRSDVRMSITNKIGELTADDVTGAVLEAQIAPGLTLKQAILDARSSSKLAAALSA